MMEKVGNRSSQALSSSQKTPPCSKGIETLLLCVVDIIMVERPRPVLKGLRQKIHFHFLSLVKVERPCPALKGLRRGDLLAYIIVVIVERPRPVLKGLRLKTPLNLV